MSVGKKPSNFRVTSATNGQVLTVDDTQPDDVKWVTPTPYALKKITGSSFSAVSSVSLPNNTFTTTYDDYLILLTITSSSAGGSVIQSRLRASGSDNSTNNYNHAVFGRDALGNNIDRNGSAVTNWDHSSNNGGFFFLPLWVSNPKAEQKTLASAQYHAMDNGWSRVATFMGAYNFNATTSFDSMSFLASTGNFTGRYVVYGLEK